MKLSINHKTSKKGFTLVELLVVIAILASLAGISYGPIMNHLQSADITKAKKVCKDLTLAISVFESEYDCLPYTGNYPNADAIIETDTDGLLKVLMGKDIAINDRAKTFFTADNAKGTKDGLIYSGNNPSQLMDKWGNPYKIMLDYDADGIVDATELLVASEGESDSKATSNYKSELHIQGAIAASGGPDDQINGDRDANSW